MYTFAIVQKCDLKFHEFATIDSNFETIDYLRHASSLNVHVHQINFQQNRVSRLVITVHTNLFAKNCKLRKLATNNSNFEKIDYLRHAPS